MIKPSVKYGLLCGIFLILTFWLSMKYGSNPLVDIRHLFLDLLVFILFIFFATKEYKTYYAKGYLHFWQGMSIGFFVYFFAVLFFAISLWIYFELDPDLLDRYKLEARAFLMRHKEALTLRVTESEFQSQLDAVGSVTVKNLVFSTIGKKMLAGFFVTPVVSIILRKNPVNNGRK